MAVSQLQRVVQIAEERRDEAAQRVAEAQQRLQEAVDQLDQLSGYQQQYIDQSAQEATRGVSAQALAESRRFVGELNGVIESQRGVVAQREREVAGMTESLVEATRYLKAVEQLIAMRKAEAEQRQVKKEQQLMDDLYGQQYVRRNPVGN